MPSKTIILKMTVAQFESLFALAEEMAITVGMSDDDTSKITRKRINLVNKAFEQNGLTHRIEA